MTNRELASLCEQLATMVSALHRRSHSMRQTQLADLPSEARLLRAPVSEARAKPVRHGWQMHGAQIRSSSAQISPEANAIRSRTR